MQMGAGFGAIVVLMTLTGAPAQAEPLPPGRCSTVVQFEPYLGDECRTLQGARFTLVRDPNTQATGWRNQKTGQVWFEAVTRSVDQFEALESCEFKRGQTLPSAGDFVAGIQDGIVELFPVMRDVAMWSSTPVTSDDTQAYIFVGANNTIVDVPRSLKSPKIGALCVSNNL